MIYLDNAATGGFKTSESVLATMNAVKFLCANPGRSGHSLSLTGARLISDARETLSMAFDCPSDKVIFTKNCTEALNTAIFGTLKKGGHVITTVYEHNSVLRPLYHLQSLGHIELDILSPTQDLSIYEVIKSKIKKNTYLVAVTSASNVTGEALPIDKIGALCKDRGLLFLVDGAQGGGHLKLTMQSQNISMLALAGHKGLYGIMGSGALLIDEKVEVSPLTFGGTGTDSFSKTQPLTYPEKLEAGTLNLPAICSLNAGVKYVMKNLAHFSEQLFLSTKYIIEELEKIEGVTCFSMPNRSGIVAFKLRDKDSSLVADILNLEYDIAVRGGIHCAPKMHEFLGTESEGLVRVSLAIQNTSKEINALLLAIKQIAKK